MRLRFGVMNGLRPIETDTFSVTKQKTTPLGVNALKSTDSVDRERIRSLVCPLLLSGSEDSTSFQDLYFCYLICQLEK